MMLEDVKLALRVSGKAFDDEIKDIIEAAKEDLYAGGVSNKAVSEGGSMVKRAIITYAKANYGMANPDSEKYYEAYSNMREKLAFSSKHNTD